MARMRRRSRNKKRYVWTGIQTFNTIAPLSPGSLVFTLVEAGSGADLARAADIVVERTIIDLNWNNAEETDRFFCAYLATFPVEITAQVPSGYWPATTTDPDAFEKRVMWWRQFRCDAGAGGTGSPVGGVLAPFDIPVKRKLRADEALVLVITQADVVAQPIRVDVLARALLSVGRR